MNNPQETRSVWPEKLFYGLCLSAVIIPLGILALLLGKMGMDGMARIDWGFITHYPSRLPARAGIFPAMVGSIYLIGLTALIAVPVGIGAAIYLQEYGKHSRWANIIELNIANLAGVPSIIYGLLGLGFFVRTLGMGRSLIAGACTLALLILPVIIMSSREALRTVPDRTREAAYGLGATQWQVVRQVVLPVAMPGMMTGAILAISRAIGETAPLIVVGALTYLTFLPNSPFSAFSALPIQIYNWVSRPQEAFVTNAASGIIVLLVIMLVMNSLAILLRNRLERRLK
jgi:phosphate transport system permease protein